MPDCSDACLVPGAPLTKGYHLPQPYALHADGVDSAAGVETISTATTDFSTTVYNGNPMVQNGAPSDGTRKFPYAKTSWRYGQYKDTNHRRLTASNVIQDFIEIECGDFCADVEAALASPSFAEKLSTQTGGVAIVNTGSIMTSPTEASMVVGGSHTSTHSEEEFEKYENATIALAVLLILAVILLAILAMQNQSLKSKANAGVIKAGETEAALGETEQYEV